MYSGPTGPASPARRIAGRRRAFRTGSAACLEHASDEGDGSFHDPPAGPQDEAALGLRQPDGVRRHAFGRGGIAPIDVGQPDVVAGRVPDLGGNAPRRCLVGDIGRHEVAGRAGDRACRRPHAPSGGLALAATMAGIRCPPRRQVPSASTPAGPAPASRSIPPPAGTRTADRSQAPERDVVRPTERRAPDSFRKYPSRRRGTSGRSSGQARKTCWPGRPTVGAEPDETGRRAA